MVFSYLITMLDVVFLIFRIIVVLTTTTEVDFIVKALNPTVEIILCFITLFCLILIIKRKLTGAIIYLVSYVMYFGINAYKTIVALQSTNDLTANYVSIGISIFAVILAFLTFADIGLNKDRKSLPDKKTDWFYKNQEYDRKFDERADRNQYKF